LLLLLAPWLPLPLLSALLSQLLFTTATTTAIATTALLGLVDE
jgi:hypothetical protein